MICKLFPISRLVRVWYVTQPAPWLCITTLLSLTAMTSSKCQTYEFASLLFCSQISGVRHQISFSFPPSIWCALRYHKDIFNQFHKTLGGGKYWQEQLGMRYSNSNLSKCRHMSSLIKWHWSGGGSLSIYPLSSLNFSLEDSSSNHLAPNETLLSLCNMIGLFCRWQLVAGMQRL